MSNVSTLNVFLYGELIGTITHVGSDRTLFAFTEDYIERVDRPILSLSFKDTFGELITNFKPTQTRLLPFFSNLLPEDTLRSYLATRAKVNSEREFYLLWALGNDLPGAITVASTDEEDYPRELIENRDVMDEQGSHMETFRFSLAGVQLKFSAIQHARGGLAIPANGVGGKWIIKLPSSHFEGVPENEFSMMELAKHIGINVPEIKLIKVNDIENLPKGINQFCNFDKGWALAIKRFDRASSGELIHIEDFAQIFGVYPQDKYKKASMRNIASVISTEGQEKDIQEFIRRLVFNTLIGNADMHLKNWSVIYSNRNNASIAPAYDFVSTIIYLPDEEAALKVSRSKRFDAFSFDELSHLASKARLSEKLVLDTAREIVALFHEIWSKEKNNLMLSHQMINTIENHIKKVPIVDE